MNIVSHGMPVIQKLMENGVRHMLRQKAVALRYSPGEAVGMCAYRTGDGAKSCIIGASLSEEAIALLTRRGAISHSVTTHTVWVALKMSGYPMETDREVKAAEVMQGVLHDKLKHLLSVCLNSRMAEAAIKDEYRQALPDYCMTFGLELPLDIQVGIGLLQPFLFTDK